MKEERQSNRVACEKWDDGILNSPFSILGQGKPVLCLRIEKEELRIAIVIASLAANATFAMAFNATVN